MFIKADFSENKCRGKITLQCRLHHNFYQNSYDSYQSNYKLDLDKVAEELRDIENDFINAHDRDTVTTLRAVTPVGYSGNYEWLVVEISKFDRDYMETEQWHDFLAEAAAKIILRLTSSEYETESIAVVETSSVRFIVMDDPDHGAGANSKKDYIFI